eukprot:gene16803-biopygen14779
MGFFSRTGPVVGASIALLLAAGGASAQAYVNATVDGQIVPGVYGRIQIGNAAPPALIYAEPVIIHRPQVPVQRAPIYMSRPAVSRPVAPTMVAHPTGIGMTTMMSDLGVVVATTEGTMMTTVATAVGMAGGTGTESS